MASQQILPQPENGKKPKITLIWLEKSRSQRIVWLLEETGLEYDVISFKRTKEYLAPPELKKYHPLGKSPVVMVDYGNDNVITLAESGLITEYLIDNFAPHLKPSDTQSANYLHYRYYMHYVEGSLMPYGVMMLIAMRIRAAPVPFFLKFVTNGVANNIMDGYVLPNVKNNFEFLEKELTERKYLAGDELSGADIMISFPLESISARNPEGGPVTKEKCPHIFEYMENYKQRPAFIRATEKLKEIESEL